MKLANSGWTGLSLLCVGLGTIALAPACGGVSEPTEISNKTQGLVEEFSFELPAELSTRSTAVAATGALRIEDRAQVKTEDGEGFAAIANTGGNEAARNYKPENRHLHR